MIENDLLIMSFLSGSTHTINEVIEKIRKSDFKSGIYRSNVHFYTHLNKRFDPLMKKGMLEIVGQKVGRTKRIEKVWTLTLKAEAALHSRFLTREIEQRMSA